MSLPETLHLRCTPDLISRIDALAEKLAATVPGMDPKRSNALRAALLAGLPVLEKKHGIAAPKAEKKPSKRGRKGAAVG